jgi:hypothetical protein
VNKIVDEWKIYRSSFLIRAKQLIDPLTFVDALGHEHRGKPGDYLVEHFSGLQRIWPRQLFEDSHVALSPDESRSTIQSWSRTTPPGPARTHAAKPANADRRANGACGKAAHESRTPAVNSLRYNI